MRIPRSPRTAFAALITTALCALAPAAASAATLGSLPDPMDTGPHPITLVNQYKVGTVVLQEPNSTGGPSTGANSSVTLQVRGSLTYPSDLTAAAPAPLIVLVHGNHGSCRQTDGGAESTTSNCTVYERNDLGYQYLASNLASHGYVVASIDQDQLMAYQDSAAGKGMHQRRLMIAATLDGFYEANQAAVPDDANHNLGDQLVGKIDFTRIGLMGHSRGGDAVTSFLDFNRTRPAPGRRYDIRGVISVAPVDYERRAPYGTNYMTLLPACDGDVSNLQGARFFERSQYISPGDPFPKIQGYLLGADHNYFNSVWSADNDDSTTNDDACGPFAANASTSIRLTGGVTLGASLVASSRPSLLGTYSRSNTTYPTQADTYGSGDPALMGDQEKAGLAIMSEFFRRYVGGETAFDGYETGELSASGDGQQLPAAACPTSASGTRIPCEQRLQTAYFAGGGQREDVIRPEEDNPLTVSALGTALTGSGFANPYTDDGGVSPKPATTDGGYDWCNPEPTQFTPSQTGATGYPTATKPCPLPAATAVGGQASNRENSPVNQSYGNQLALAWQDPVAATGSPATLSTRIPEANGDVSHLRALAMGAAVNYFDPRNPPRTGGATWNPALTDQHFALQLTDAEGHVASVDAGARRYGTALEQSTGNSNARLHIILNPIRVPLEDFAAQGLDLTKVRRLSLVFGAGGMSTTGSVQLADVRFQEAAAAIPDSDPASFIAATTRAPASAADPDVVQIGAASRSAGTCADRARPTAKVASVRVAGRRLTMTGTAADKGCAAKGAAAARKGRVRLVEVTLRRAAGKRCAFVRPNGRLGKPLPCSAKVGLVARGTSRWSLKLGGPLARGRYTAVVSVVDAAGNVRTYAARRVKVA